MQRSSWLHGSGLAAVGVAGAAHQVIHVCVQVDLPAVPVMMAITGSIAVGYRIVVACRDAKSLELRETPEHSESPDTPGLLSCYVATLLYFLMVLEKNNEA